MKWFLSLFQKPRFNSELQNTLMLPSDAETENAALRAENATLKAKNVGLQAENESLKASLHEADQAIAQRDYQIDQLLQKRIKTQELTKPLDETEDRILTELFRMGPLSITEINLSFRLSRREVADRLKFLEAKDYILYGKDGHWTLADKGREYLIEQRLV